MRMRSMLPVLTTFTLLFAVPAGATINAYSDGSDGALSVTAADLTIDLSQAVTGTWSQAGNGRGVYDSTKWAVVFKYSSINIASGRTVRFINHPSGAPVVWLVQGKATIAGTVNLDGESGNNTQNRETVPGPGGFPGGRGTYTDSPGTHGHGPGGGVAGFVNNDVVLGGGAYATAPAAGTSTYGSTWILPLIGGSGGGGSTNYYSSGGAGGGAILIVGGQAVHLTGGIRAYGGAQYVSGNTVYSGEGSGGAVRIIADTLSGTGGITATGWNSRAGLGRIRLEANVLSYASQTSPAYSLLQPLAPAGAVLWPSPPEPTIRVASINGQPVPADPRMDAQGLVTGSITIPASSLVPITLAGTNLPTNSTVTVRVVLGRGGVYTTNATFVSGDANSSTWSATLVALSPSRVSAVQAKAVIP